MKSPSSPTAIPPSPPPPPLLPVPNKPYGFCGRLAPCLLTKTTFCPTSSLSPAGQRPAFLFKTYFGMSYLLFNTTCFNCHRWDKLKLININNPFTGLKMPHGYPILWVAISRTPCPENCQVSATTEFLSCEWRLAGLHVQKSVKC